MHSGNKGRENYSKDNKIFLVWWGYYKKNEVIETAKGREEENEENWKC